MKKLDSVCFQCYKSMLGLFYQQDGNISKVDVYARIDVEYPSFELTSDFLRSQRLRTWDHMVRKDKKLLKKVIGYSPSIIFCKFLDILTLPKLIAKDRILLRQFEVPRLILCI